MKKETQVLIDRLSRIDYSKFNTNENTIAKKFNESLTALGLPNRNIEIYQNAKEAIFSFNPDIDAARDTAWDATWVATRETAWVATWVAAWDADWDATRDAARGADWDATRVAARDAAWDAAWVAARGATRDAARGADWDATWVATWDAARDAARVAVAEEIFYGQQEYNKFKDIWMPLFEAMESGLFIFLVTKNKIIAIQQPIMKLKNNQLHSEEGPAVIWPNEEYYFLNGIQVPEWLVNCKKEDLDINKFNSIVNADVKAQFIKKSGMENMKSFGKTIDKFDKYNDPWWKKSEYELLDMGEFMSDSGFQNKYCPYLWMKNQTTGVYHLEGIHPKCKTIGEAIDFQLGIDEKQDYKIGGIK